MKKESFQGILLGIVIMCAVFAFITVAWAAFSSTLTISGTATIKAQSWKVEFSDTATAVLAGSAATSTVTPSTASVAPSTAPTLTTSAFGGSSVSLANFSNPGEKIEYSWYVVNDGTFDANITTITGIKTAADTTTGSNVNITCSATGLTFGTGATVSDASTWCAKYVKAVLEVNSVVVTTDSSNNLTSTATKVSAKSGTTLGNVPVKLTLQYLDVTNTADLPNADITVSLPSSGIVMTFSQDTSASATTAATTAASGS